MLISRPGIEKFRSQQKTKIKRLKILSLGDAGVGKSCLIKRFCEKRFEPKYISTIGIDYGTKRVSITGSNPNIIHKVDFWDLAGGSEYAEIRSEFYKNSDGLLLTFDSNDKSSFNNLESWLEEGKSLGLAPKVVIVISTKSDKTRGTINSIEESAKSWASSKGYFYYNTSAKSGEGIDEAFEHLFQSLLKY